MSEPFTAQMRDRQARGKNPYNSDDSSDDGNLHGGESGTGAKLRLGTGRYVMPFLPSFRICEVVCVRIFFLP
jgi:hypothetical protein